MATPIPDNSARFAPEELARVLGTPSVPVTAPLTGVVTDSRRVRPGQLYVALRGEHHDGHAFLSDVVGVAGAAVVERGTTLPSELPGYGVEDTLVALGSLARAHRRRWPGRVVALTGSAGKTTTKELAAAAFRQLGMQVMRTEGNLNNRIGVPMTLLTLQSAHELAVVEAGTSLRGEIAALTAIIEPDVAVITGVSVAHAEGLGSLEAVADEKASIFEGLRDDGVAVYCADSPELCERVRRHPGPTLGFGLSAHADVRLLSHAIGHDLHSHCRFSVRGLEAPVEARLQMLGVGPAVDAAAVLCCALALQGEASIPGALRGLAACPATDGRLKVVVGPGGSSLIDDTYNANPASMHASLHTLSELARVRGGRAVAVLGDMKELGESSAEAHAEVGRLVARLGVAHFVGCGEAMQAAVDAARSAGCDAASHVRDATGAAVAVRQAVGRLAVGDVVLLKGSRSMRMERVLDALPEVQG